VHRNPWQASDRVNPLSFARKCLTQPGHEQWYGVLLGAHHGQIYTGIAGRFSDFSTEKKSCDRYVSSIISTKGSELDLRIAS
jgi:hypothetical protein